MMQLLLSLDDAVAPVAQEAPKRSHSFDTCHYYIYRSTCKTIEKYTCVYVLYMYLGSPDGTPVVDLLTGRCGRLYMYDYFTT